MPKKTDAALASELQRKGHLAFNWDDLDTIELPLGIVTSIRVLYTSHAADDYSG